MKNRSAAKPLRIAELRLSSPVGGADRPPHRLSDLADVEVEMQNAIHCIRLRGDDDPLPIETLLRRAA